MKSINVVSAADLTELFSVIIIFYIFVMNTIMNNDNEAIKIFAVLIKS